MAGYKYQSRRPSGFAGAPKGTYWSRGALTRKRIEPQTPPLAEQVPPIAREQKVGGVARPSVARAPGASIPGVPPVVPSVVPPVVAPAGAAPGGVSGFLAGDMPIEPSGAMAGAMAGTLSGISEGVRPPALPGAAGAFPEERQIKVYGDRFTGADPIGETKQLRELVRQRGFDRRGVPKGLALRYLRPKIKEFLGRLDRRLLFGIQDSLWQQIESIRKNPKLSEEKKLAIVEQLLDQINPAVAAKEEQMQFQAEQAALRAERITERQQVMAERKEQREAVEATAKAQEKAETERKAEEKERAAEEKKKAEKAEAKTEAKRKEAAAARTKQTAIRWKALTRDDKENKAALAKIETQHKEATEAAKAAWEAAAGESKDSAEHTKAKNRDKELAEIQKRLEAQRAKTAKGTEKLRAHEAKTAAGLEPKASKAEPSKRKLPPVGAIKTQGGKSYKHLGSNRWSLVE